MESTGHIRGSEHINAEVLESFRELFIKQYCYGSETQRATMDWTHAGVSSETMSANIARKIVSEKMRNKSSSACIAQNKRVLMTGYRAATILQLREREQRVPDKRKTQRDVDTCS